jgi:NAD+ kinase
MKKLVIGADRSLAIVYRPETPAALSLAKALATWLKERDYRVFTAPEQNPVAGTKLLKSAAALEKMSLMVVLGGDGTYLRAVRLLNGRSVPILGVNLGSLGFLTPTRADELFTAVDEALKNKMELRPRSMIQAQLLRKGKKKLELLALNDIVIERGSLSQLINLSVHSEKMLVSEVKADGLIISTPTGSTAYNLSAGGPILHPESRVFIVTPIAPHSLTSRPLIFPDEIQLSFRMVGKLQSSQAHRSSKKFAKDRAHFVVDGVKVDDISVDDEILIRRHKVDHLMVRDPAQNYFHLLREKLKFGDRA